MMGSNTLQPLLSEDRFVGYLLIKSWLITFIICLLMIIGVMIRDELTTSEFIDLLLISIIASIFFFPFGLIILIIWNF